MPKDLVAAKAGPFEYLVSIHRFNRPKEFLVYPITLRQRLPRIAIPSRPATPTCLLTYKKYSTNPTILVPTAVRSNTARTRSCLA